MALFAVDGDNNNHGGGNLIAQTSKTYVDGKLVCTEVTPANPDGICPEPSIHCTPSTSTYSSKTYVEGKLVHRVGDSRICGAVTIETGCHNTYCE